MTPVLTIKKALYCGLYFLALLAVTAKLFFEPQFDAFFTRLQGEKAPHTQTLTIGLSEPALSQSPLAFDSGSRTRLLHIFEPLVRMNRQLSIEPGLAVSFGSLSETTWELRLRRGVQFHDGSPLTLEDVIFSLTQARDNPASQLRDLTSCITKITPQSAEILHIETRDADPLFLQKLSSVLIFKNHIGTGPYAVEKNEDDTLSLTRFEEYWGQKPDASSVALKTLSSKSQKFIELGKGSVDILAAIPPETALDFPYQNYHVVAQPSLEVNFLMFNFEGPFKDRRVREAVNFALHPGLVSSLAQGFGAATNQFAPPGVRGFDPQIPERRFDPAAAQKLIAELKAEKAGQLPEVILDLPKGLETFGQKIADQLQKVGLEVELNFIAPSTLAQKIARGNSDFYFFGWKNDLGDSGDFLSAVAHSRTPQFGQFNGGNFKNAEVDELIEKSMREMNPEKRLNLLRSAMRRVTVDEIIGVPLFSPEVLYAVSKNVQWQPRIDGYVLAQEVKL